MMRSLETLQREFMEALRAPAPSDERMAVHHGNVRAGLHDALAAVFPVVRRLVGPAFFRAAAEHHAERIPSRSADLHAYGGSFGDFLARYPPASALPYLPDVARLEWARHRAYFAADPPPFDFGTLAAVDSRRHGVLVFQLHPAARVLASAHPVLSIWQANQPDRDGSLGGEEGPEHVLVHRPRNEVLLQRLEPADHAFLEAVWRGEPLAAIADSCGLEPPLGLATRLPRWVAAGVLVSFRFAEAISPAPD